MFYPSLHFNNSIVAQTAFKKNLCTFLNDQLTFEKPLKVITTNINRTIRILWKLQNILPRPVLI